MTHQNDSDTLARDETSDMIASDKVEGTTVYHQRGDRLGTVKHFMVGKRDGRVRYAVMSFGMYGAWVHVPGITIASSRPAPATLTAAAAAANSAAATRK